MYKSNLTGYTDAIRHVSMLFLVCFLIVLLPGCMSGSENDNNNNPNRAQGPASLKIVLGDNRVNKALDNDALPEGIDRIVVKVTDRNETTLDEGDILAAGGALTLSVPSGVILTLRGLAFAGESLNFQAQTNVGPLIADVSTSVSLTLVPVGDNASELNSPIQIDIGGSGNTLSNRAIFSDNNQIILFKSEADNLVIGDTNGRTDFFLKDRGNNRITNVHTNSANEQADGAAVSADMSADGRVIVFESEASNLASNPVDSNGFTDIFIKELDTNTTTRISVTSANQETNWRSYQPSLSEDGQIAVFVSDNSLTDAGAAGVYLKNLSNGDLEYLGAGQAPSLSGDGSHVILWDTTTQTLKLYNVAEKTSVDLIPSYIAPEASEAVPYDINTTGQLVVFAQQGGNTAGDEAELNNGIYLYDNVSNTAPTIRLISTDSDGVALDTTSSPAITPSLSGEGRYIVYAIGTTIHVKDSTTGAATQLAQAGALPSLSKNGQWIGYTISEADSKTKNLYIVSNPLFSETPGSPPGTSTTKTLMLTIKGGPNAGLVRSDDGDETTIPPTLPTLFCANVDADETICNGEFPHGQEVKLFPTLGENKNAVIWTGCEDDNAGLDGCTVILTENKNIIANFALVAHTLNIKREGEGEGVVTSENEAIDCGDTCEASFTEGENVVLIANAASNSVFTEWQGACSGTASRIELTLTEATECTASFALADFSLSVSSTSSSSTITSSDDGINCGEDCNETYTSGTTVTLTANAANDDVFVAWSGSEQCTGTTPVVEIKVEGNISCVAEFLVRYELTVLKTGGGTITSSPVGINCGDDCSETYEKDTEVTLAAAAASGFVFTSWSGACSGGNSSTSVTLSGAKSCTANFTQRFALTVSKVGTGTITSNPGGIDCGEDCDQAYNKDTSVTLTATAGDGFVFTSWSGACSDSGAVIIDTDKSCTANFEAETKRFSLSVLKVGTGTVTSSPGGIDCGGDCEEAYDEGTQVTLAATAGDGFVFTSWTGACSDSGAVIIDTDKSCTANFEAETKRFTLDVLKVGTGTVISNPGGIDCGADCEEAYDEGTQVTLAATAGDGFVFTSWSGACSDSGTVTMDANKSCTANFEAEIERFSLTVLIEGPGSPGTVGTVTSSPRGINCGDDCGEEYNEDTEVTLTAKAADGFVFRSWGGACSDSGTVTMDADKSCTANFDAVAVIERFTLTVEKSGTGSGFVGRLNENQDESLICEDGEEGNDDCTGSRVNLITRPDEGSEFKGWSGDNCDISQNGVVIINADTRCIATFDLSPSTSSIISNIRFSPSSSSAELPLIVEEVKVFFDYQTSEAGGVISVQPFTR